MSVKGKVSVHVSRFWGSESGSSFLYFCCMA